MTSNISICAKKFSQFHLQSVLASTLRDNHFLSFLSSKMDYICLFWNAIKIYFYCIWSLYKISFTQHNVTEIHPCCCMFQEFVSFYCWVVFCCLNLWQFVYPFLCWGTPRPVSFKYSFWILWLKLWQTFIFTSLEEHFSICLGKLLDWHCRVNGVAYLIL